MREGERAREREKKKESARARASSTLSRSPSLSVSLSEVRKVATLSHITYLSTSLRKSTPPQNRKLHISISNSKRKIDNFVRELSFSKTNQ